MARFAPSSADSTSTAASSTMLRRRGASRAPVSSLSFIPPLWKKVLLQRPSSTMRRFPLCGGNRKRAVGSTKFRRQLRRPVTHAGSACQIQESGIDSYSSGNRRSICAGLCRPLRFRSQAASSLFADGVRRRIGDTDTDGGGLCRVRQWRFSRITLFHPAHRG